MKKFALICMFATLAFAANAQNGTTTEVPANGAKIRFEEMEHKYGTIQKGGDGTCEFTFWNDGNEPLILQNVKASCGCTTPSYTQKPVMPGQSGVITVKYNTNNVGSFSKTVTVTSNAVDNPRVVLRISGKVEGDNNQSAAQQRPAVQPKQDNRKPAEPAKPTVEPKQKGQVPVKASNQAEGPAPMK